MIDFNWDINNCPSCRLLGKCKYCIYITGIEIDMKPLIVNTILPELWKIFVTAISFTPVTETGFSFSGASAYLSGVDIDVPHDEFWRVMSFFLRRLNQEFMRKKNSRKRT